MSYITYHYYHGDTKFPAHGMVRPIYFFILITHISLSMVALPLILPPTVLGFYILLAIGPRSPVGALYATLTGGLLPFSFPGLLIASVL